MYKLQFFKAIREDNFDEVYEQFNQDLTTFLGRERPFEFDTLANHVQYSLLLREISNTTDNEEMIDLIKQLIHHIDPICSIAYDISLRSPGPILDIKSKIKTNENYKKIFAPNALESFEYYLKKLISLAPTIDNKFDLAVFYFYLHQHQDVLNSLKQIPVNENSPEAIILVTTVASIRNYHLQHEHDIWKESNFFQKKDFIDAILCEPISDILHKPLEPEAELKRLLKIVFRDIEKQAANQPIIDEIYAPFLKYPELLTYGLRLGLFEETNAALKKLGTLKEFSHIHNQGAILLYHLLMNYLLLEKLGKTGKLVNFATELLLAYANKVSEYLESDEFKNLASISDILFTQTKAAAFDNNKIDKIYAVLAVAYSLLGKKEQSLDCQRKALNHAKTKNMALDNTIRERCSELKEYQITETQQSIPSAKI